VLAVLSCFSKIHFNIVIPHMSRSTQWSLYFWPSHQNPMCISLLPMRDPCRVQLYLAKRTIYEAPYDAVVSNSLSFHLSSVLIFISSPHSETPSFYVRPLITRNKVSGPYKPRGKITFLYIYIFTFSDSRRTYKISELNGSKYCPLNFDLLLSFPNI
jgi:hypothetical protein